MRSALIFGGISSFVLVLALLLAMPSGNKGYALAASFDGGVPFILGFNLTPWIQDVVLLAIIYAFFSCGSSVQGAGARLAFSYARDGAIPGSKTVSHVSPRFHTPVNALLIGASVPVVATLLVNINPAHDHKFLFVTYPAGLNALVVLVSFAVSGIYLAFLMTVIGAIVARRRGWQPAGSFTMGRWGLPVTIAGAAYLGLMLLNVVVPSGLSSGRAQFNYDWITLVVMVLIAIVGAIVYLIAQPTKNIAQHVAEPVPAGGVPGQRTAPRDTPTHHAD